MMWYWASGTPWWGWLLGCVGMLVTWAAVTWSIWYLVTYAAKRSEPERGGAARILDERLARSEIDPEEYRCRRELIRIDAPEQKDVRAPVSTAKSR